MKRAQGWPPRWLAPVPAQDARRGDGAHAVDWIETFCRATEDSIAASSGELLKLRAWQRNVLGGILARRKDGRYRHRQALVGVARKNTKSTIGSGLALYGLCSDYPGGPQGREVYSCAGDRDQAKIVFNTAKRVVELDPDLNGIIKPYRDALEVVKTGSIYRALSSEAYSKEGLNPTLVIFDEVHVQPDRTLWDVMALAMGARREPLLVGITTAGVRYDSSGQDSLAYQLYQYGRKVASGELADPSFYFAWWEPEDPEADHMLASTQRAGNPGYGDLVSAEDLEFAARTTPEAEFRTKRCNQWVMASRAWLPHGAWEALGGERELEELSRVVLAFDGSFNNDSTGIVAVEVAEKPHVQVVECWERPADADEGWRVPIADVEESLRQACRRFQVVEIACDPARWAKSYQALEAEGLPVEEFPQSPERMTPATQRFYEAVVNRGISHSGDPQLARHVGNAVLKVDARGMRIVKETKNSPRKIDLAVCAVMGLHRAAWWQGQEEAEALVRYGS